MSKRADTSQIGPLYERWERMEQARRQQQDAFKDLFAEAKARGLNSKALRVAFAAAYADEFDAPGKRQKREADEVEIEIYSSALARVREVRDAGADLETGEITEPRPVHSAAQADAEAADTVRHIAAGGDAAATPAPNPEAKASVGNGATETATEGPSDSVSGDVSRPSVGGGSDAPIQPETANQSTAASVSEPRLGMSMPGKDASRTIPQASHADIREAVTDPHRESGETNSGAIGGRQLQPALRTGVAPGVVDTYSEKAAGTPPVGEVSLSASPTPKRNPTFEDDPHPDCRRPSGCGGFSQLGLCETCRAAAHGEVAA